MDGNIFAGESGQHLTQLDKLGTRLDRGTDRRKAPCPPPSRSGPKFPQCEASATTPLDEFRRSYEFDTDAVVEELPLSPRET